MISVCIASYNGDKYIKKQIHSILSQLESNDELIISDDGSTDNTLKIIDSIKDSRIKLIKNSSKVNNKNLFYKVTKNFESAILESKGDLILLADQDDIWVENKIEIIKNKIGDNWVLVHDCELIDQNENVIHNSYFALIKCKRGFFNNIVKSSYLGCCMAFKTNIKHFFFPFPSLLPVPHDIWIGLISEFYGKSIFINDKLIRYRRHNSNLSTSGEKSRFSFSFKIKYRLFIILALINRLLKFNINQKK